MTTILSLDTTSRFASAAISKGDDILLEYNFSTRDQLSASLIPTLEFVLASAPLELEEIDAFGIAVGPGLFTGIRVGLATLKGLLLGTTKPVIPVVTLTALAYKLSQSKRPVLSLIDARRDEFYIAGYRFEPGPGSGPQNACTEISPPALLHIGQLEAHVQAMELEGKIRFVGSGAEVHRGYIRERFKNSSISNRSGFLAGEICKIAHERYLEKDYITDLQQLMPFYIRKPDAQQSLGSKEKKGDSGAAPHSKS